MKTPKLQTRIVNTSDLSDVHIQFGPPREAAPTHSHKDPNTLKINK